MKPACVEFYENWPTVKTREYGWRLRAKNGQIICTPHETFQSHRNAVESFKRICNALDARGPWQIKDLDGVQGSHAMLIGK
jgi:uncharacterized protein YegP (UPF0339 family)